MSFQAARGYPLKSRRASNALANLRTAGYLGIERKFVDYTVTNTALTAALATCVLDPAVGCLNATAQADGPTARDGRQQRNDGVFIRGHFRIPLLEATGNPIQGMVIRYGVIKDLQTNGAACTGDQVFDTNTVTTYQAFTNLQNSKRFSVLFDKQVRLQPQTLAQQAANDFSVNEVKVPFKINLPNCKDETTYTITSTAAAVANITDVSYHFFAIADQITNGPLVTYTSRLRFYG